MAVSSDNILISTLVAEDPEMRDLVEDFVSSLQARLQEFRSAHKSGDFPRLKVLAHQLKGAGGSYGYPDLTQLAADVEPRFATGDGTTFAQFEQRFMEMIHAAQRGLAAG